MRQMTERVRIVRPMRLPRFMGSTESLRFRLPNEPIVVLQGRWEIPELIEPSWSGKSFTGSQTRTRRRGDSYIHDFEAVAKHCRRAHHPDHAVNDLWDYRTMGTARNEVGLIFADRALLDHRQTGLDLYRNKFAYFDFLQTFAEQGQRSRCNRPLLCQGTALFLLTSAFRKQRFAAKKQRSLRVLARVRELCLQIFQ